MRLDEGLLEIKRVKMINGVRVAWMVDYVPEAVLDPETVIREFSGSVLDLFMTKPEVGLAYSEADISPVGLASRIARKLEVEENTPGLFIDEVLFNQEGRAIEGGHSWLLPDYFRFRLRRRLPF